jgi:Family of unknown function (DUF5856)
MKIFKEFVEKKNASAFFSKLFATRDHAHKLHLATKSYSQHKALNSFYDELLDLMDQIIETYQGEYDLVKLNLNNEKGSDDPESFLTDFGKYIKDSRKMFEGDDHIQNLIDEITALTYRTLYKIRFLK